MQAEIIAVGSELLGSQRLDTNSLYLTDELNSLGVEVVTKCVIGDDRERLASAVRRAVSGAGVVIVTGGLGPTEDDVTREAVALALDRRLRFQEDIAARLEHRFRQMGRVMAEINKRQAFLIEGAEALPNDRGTAPGQWVEESGAVIMLLPGPPHELKAMFAQQCRPRLERILPRLAIRSMVMRVAGMTESDLDALISPVYKKYENPVTTILAHAGDIQVHFRACCGSEEEAFALLAEVAAPIEQLLADRLYSRNGEPLEDVVGSMLRERRSTLAVAESCTGGLLAERITGVPGSSDYFLGGFVTYTEGMKTDLLGVSPELLEAAGAVSAEVAEAMAVGARRRTGATYALSITGVAGPAQGRDRAPVGLVFVGLADRAGTKIVSRQFLGDRTRIRQFASQMALDLLRRRMLGL